MEGRAKVIELACKKENADEKALEILNGYMKLVAETVFPREGMPGPKRGYWRSCKTAGFEGFSSLVNTASSGYQSLDDDYYDALTECTTRIVSHLS